MKKMIALLLCLCMAASLAVPAFATEGTDAAALLAGLAETIPAETDGDEEAPAALETADSGDTLLTTDSGDGSDEDTASDDNTASDEDTAPDDDNTASDGDGSDDGDADGDGEEAPAFTVPASGSLTETITWAVDENYVLTVTGTGAMPDYEHSSKTPWGACRLDVTAIHIGEGITHVGNNAFDWCSNVTETTLPDTLVSIGEWAFGNGATGTTIDLPIGLKSIGKNAFHLNKLTSVTLPVGLESVGESAFAGGSIEDVTIPAGVELGVGVFGSNPVKILTLEEGCTALPAVNVFNSNNGITVLHLPSTIETLDGEFIEKVTALETVTVAPDADGNGITCWVDENGNTYSTNDLISGVDGTLTAFRGIFADVAEESWYYDYVMYCYETGLMAGMGEGIFAPGGSATRAQVVMVLYRLDGEPEITADCPFPDVDEDAWFHDAIVWAAENEITLGYDDGCFYPMTEVTREQFLVFLNRFTVYKKLSLNTWSDILDLTDTGITDVSSISSWALEAETWSVALELQAGYDNGDGTYSLNPGSYITRAELATFLSRYYENINLYAYAEAAQYLVGHPAEYATRVFGETDGILEDEDGLEWWCFDGYGIAVLVDRGTIVGWDYLN